MRALYWIHIAAALAYLVACSPSKATQIDDGAPVIETLVPESGLALVVTGPSTILPGQYDLPPIAGDEEAGVLRLTGITDLTLDLRQVEFRGAPEGSSPDSHAGRGLVLENCENVTILGGSWWGYGTPVTVTGSRGIRLQEVQIDGFWSRSLESTSTRDSAEDWLEPMDWMAPDYGGQSAGFEVIDSADVVVQRCRARHGAVGLLLRNSRDSLVAGNDFSFLSAYGVVLADALDNTVAHNWLEYNVRGYSHGTYASGQNSAGVLLAGSSQRNRVAFNRLTHCGSGALLWGEGEQVPVDNRIYGNDGEHAIFAGVYCRNTRGTLIQNNRVSKAIGYGIHSYADLDLVLLENEISDVTGPGVGVFSSTGASLLKNDILRNQIGLEIAWGAPDPEGQTAPLAGSSSDHHVLGNRFESNGQDLVARDSQALSFAGNQFLGERQRLHVQRIQAWLGPDEDPRNAPAEDTVVGWLAGSNGVMPTGNLSGVSLRLWDGEMPSALEVAQSLDPPRIPGYPDSDGRAVSEHQGGVETVVVGLMGPWDYPSGEAQTQMRQPGGLFGKARWQARWFAFDPQTQDPRGDVDQWRVLAENPILRRTVDHFLEPRPGEEIKERVPPIRFGVMAETQVEVPVAGNYRLSVMSDDGIRIWFGDELVFEDWTWHATRLKDVVVPMEVGSQPIYFEYFQLDGAAELVLELHRVR